MDCPVTARPTVIVISDSLGDTACEVVLAASGQFDEGAFRLLRLPKVNSVEQVKSFVGPRVDADHRDIAVFCAGRCGLKAPRRFAPACSITWVCCTFARST